jgi:hypothetical protein
LKLAPLFRTYGGINLFRRVRNVENGLCAAPKYPGDLIKKELPHSTSSED